ncbi:MAG: HTH domain-containing protein [Pseudomonadota bacterium]
MRAARLLRILLILQNRGRQTSRELAEELEVAPRTILRDVDAMTEAGLPIIVLQGNQGGIELGFNYRTRLTGLTVEEARALGLILGARSPMIEALGLGAAARQARAKLIESLPDLSRAQVETMVARFAYDPPATTDDPRIAALAKAVEAGRIVRLRYTTAAEQVIHPSAMALSQDGWHVHDAATGADIGQNDWGRINISARKF